WIVIERLSRGRAPTRRFQVVSFVDSEGIPVAKRVVAFAGETIRIDKKRVLYIDGAPVESPPGVGRGQGYIRSGVLSDDTKDFLVPPGTVFLLGDDAQDSEDSRWTGPLPISKIRGRAFLRVWP